MTKTLTIQHRRYTLTLPITHCNVCTSCRDAVATVARLPWGTMRYANNRGAVQWPVTRQNSPFFVHTSYTYRSRPESRCQISDTGNRPLPVSHLHGLVQGNCSEAPPPEIEVSGVPLVPLTPGQCLLLTDKSLFYLGAGRLWMHNLYVRHTATQVGYPVVWLVSTANSHVESHLWMTSCTLQGHGGYESGLSACGLNVRSKAYVEGRLLFIRTPAPASRTCQMNQTSIGRQPMIGACKHD